MDSIEENYDAKVIISPQLANYLLKKGHLIIEIKPKHNAINETVFVFLLEEGLMEDISEWRSRKRQ